MDLVRTVRYLRWTVRGRAVAISWWSGCWSRWCVRYRIGMMLMVMMLRRGRSKLRAVRCWPMLMLRSGLVCRYVIVRWSRDVLLLLLLLLIMMVMMLLWILNRGWNWIVGRSRCVGRCWCVLLSWAAVRRGRKDNVGRRLWISVSHRMVDGFVR